MRLNSSAKSSMIYAKSIFFICTRRKIKKQQRKLLLCHIKKYQVSAAHGSWRITKPSFKSCAEVVEMFIT
jgi:hypothetical protein